MQCIKRLSVSLSEEQENAIIEMRKTDECCRLSYSEIIRMLIDAGMKVMRAEKRDESA